MEKRTRLTLKGIDESTGKPFIKEIHSLDEVKKSGCYTVIARDASTQEGMPKITDKTSRCFCCEGILNVSCCYDSDESQSNSAYGQNLIICDKETGCTNSYSRTIAPNSNDGKWSSWQMVATGDIELLKENNDINQAFSNMSEKVTVETTRATAAEQQIQKDLGAVGLVVGKPLTDVCVSTDYNLIHTTTPFDIVTGEKLKIRVELSEPLRREGDTVYIYLYDEAGNRISYLGGIEYNGQFFEKTVNSSNSYKNAYVRYTLTYSKDYTITTTVEQANNLPTQIAALEGEVKAIGDDVAAIAEGMKEYKLLDKYETKTGYITANGTLITSVSYLRVDYYNAVPGVTTYKASANLTGASGIYIGHFFDASGGYLGHAEPKDTTIEGYLFPVPEETAVIALTRYETKTTSLSALTVPEKSVAERLSALESDTLANSCIVAFGDSITAMSDDMGKSYIDYVGAMTGATVHNAGVGGSRLTVAEECAFIKITSKATANGDVTVKGAVRNVTFYASVSDTVEQLASKLFEAYKAVNSILAYAVNGAEVTVRTWSGRSESINVAAIKCETSTGVTIEARQNKYGMFETFTSTYIAYSNLDIPHMVYGLTSGDWRCQKLAASYLSSQGVAGMVEKIAALEALSIDQVDMVTIAGGTNNYANADWGEPDSENTALLAGGMNEIVHLLLTAKPSLKVAFFTPIPRYFGSSISAWDDTLWGDNYVVNGLEGVMPALVEKIVAVAKRNHIAVHDMYYSIGWNRWNFAKFFKNGDGTHPAYGLEWMAQKIAKYL